MRRCRDQRQFEINGFNAGNMNDQNWRADSNYAMYEIYKAHPEYFALVKQADGTMKRQGNQLELGNPALRKLVIDWAVDFFKKNPTADMVSVDPADGGGVSDSGRVLPYGSDGLCYRL